jgi:translocation and assembly module TamB
MVRLEQFQLDAIIAPERIEVRHVKGTLDGEAFYAEGEWPLAPDFWTRLRERPKALDWSGAQGRLEIANAKVAVLSRYAPLWLAPEGQMQANLVLRPGRVLDGLIVVTNASTRPLGEISPLRDISARLQFTGEEATLTDFRGELGGQPVRATGLARFASAKEMEYQLRLQGSNVPLSRSVEFLLRGDLDVQLKGNLRTPPSLSGQVLLRDGLFVQHATAFMLSMPERPSLRPPYFTVTNVPFADWQLDLSVRGEQFLRVRTPVFAGSVSANVRLSGQLREPVMVGDAHVAAGRVMFPFGTLDMDQAYANLDAQSARGPELLVRASGRNYRYDIRLEIKGPADGANVLFTSTPPLTSEEILLMLTAGELPKAENGFSTSARAGQLATFLGRDLVSRITGSGSGRERLIINTSENLTEEGKTTYSVEYRLTDRWSLVGEYDRFSEINAAVKWRILSR